MKRIIPSRILPIERLADRQSTQADLRRDDPPADEASKIIASRALAGQPSNDVEDDEEGGGREDGLDA